MGHNSAKVLMGSTQSSDRTVDNKLGAVEAGKVCCLKSDGTVTSAAADGAAIGISLGKDLSDAGRTNIVRKGLGVPVLLTAAFSPTPGTQVHISDTTGLAIAAGAGATGMNATYASGPKTAIKEDGTEVANGCALIDMPGGL